MEDGLASLDKGLKGLALGVLGALLVDGEVDKVNHLRDDVAGVLQTNGHVVRAGHALEVLEKVYGILLSQIESIVVLLIISDTRQLSDLILT